MPLGCGACNLCCKLLGVPDIDKPARVLCWHTGVHGGCAVHEQKLTDPKLQACRQFECLWLQSQKQSDPDKRHPREWRPDQTHVVMGPQDRKDEKLFYVHVDPDYPAAWKDPIVFAYLKGITSRGARLEIVIGELIVKMPSKDPSNA